MSFVALKSIKVQTADGVIETRKPGDAVPEAAGWKNLQAYIDTKTIKRVGVDEKPAAKPTKLAPRALDDANESAPAPMFGFVKPKK